MLTNRQSHRYAAPKVASIDCIAMDEQGNRLRERVIIENTRLLAALVPHVRLDQACSVLCAVAPSETDFRAAVRSSASVIRAVLEAHGCERRPEAAPFTQIARVSAAVCGASFPVTSGRVRV